MEKQIDCKFTRELVCPYCGYKFEDSYRFFCCHEVYEADEDVECKECGKAFIAFHHITVDYSTAKKDEDLFKAGLVNEDGTKLNADSCRRIKDLKSD